MSLLNLSNSNLPSDPEIASAVIGIRQWVESNDWADFIEPTRLWKELPNCRPAFVQLALNWLVEAGKLRSAYRPISPYTHQIVSEDFDAPVRTGRIVRDSLNHKFPADEADFVQVYVGPK